MLEVRSVSRRFGETVALDEASLTVPSGSMVGFVGGNGAGKTTTMRIIMGVLAADSGAVRFRGHTVTSLDRRRFGYMPEERGLYPKQQVLDQLAYLGSLRGMAPTDARRAALAYLTRFGLDDKAKAKLETLSLGNQQRVQITAALLADPVALILDEPFSGLDPDAVDEMAHVLREHTSLGVPVLFSSHQLELVDRLCDRIVVLARGRVVAAGTTDELRARGVVRHRLVLDIDAGWVRDQPGLYVVDVDGPVAVVEPDSDEATQRLLREAMARGSVREYARVVPSLSEIYREVTA
ncbi:MAG: ABC transporter ATP-binding protein [Dermatophilaceae bacterium]